MNEAYEAILRSDEERIKYWKERAVKAEDELAAGIEGQKCVECGKTATHLHGSHYGLEPCCGGHEDCEEDEK